VASQEQTFPKSNGGQIVSISIGPGESETSCRFEDVRSSFFSFFPGFNTFILSGGIWIALSIFFFWSLSFYIPA
jgi:hypothetical protein